jgi:hypothetical protein
MQPELVWHGSELVEDWSCAKPVGGITLRANSEGFSAVAETQENGSYELVGLPVGKYEVVPDAANGLHVELTDADEDLMSGSCRQFNFKTLAPPRPLKDQLEEARKRFDKQRSRLFEFETEHHSEQEFGHIMADYNYSRHCYESVLRRAQDAAQNNHPGADNPKN